MPPPKTCPDCQDTRNLTWLKTYTRWKLIAWCQKCAKIKVYWQQKGEERD